MKYLPTFIFFSIFILFTAFLVECNRKTSTEQEISEAEVVELEEYRTVVAFDDTTVAVPSVLKHDGDSSLFVYDKSKFKVVELDGNGNIENEYGRRGRGPGEFLWVNNIFLTEKNIYAVDDRQYIIHKYDQSGELISSMNYKEIMGLGNPNTPPRPFSPSSVYAENIENKPFITPGGDMLLSSIQFSDTAQTIFEMRDWEGEHLADIGEVPEGSSFKLDNDELHDEAANREIPGLYKPNAFPVGDQANPNEYFLVYTAFPKIAKYNADGKKLWENDIPSTPETDSIQTHFYEFMDQVKSRNRITLRYYSSGVSSPEGDLFLITDSGSHWIHQFNSEGALQHRYKLISDVELVPIFTIDFSDRRIFIVTEEAEIRSYSF